MSLQASLQEHCIFPELQCFRLVYGTLPHVKKKCIEKGEEIADIKQFRSKGRK